MKLFDELIQKCRDIEPPTPKLLAIGASPRKSGNSDVLLKQIVDGAAQHSIAADSLQLRDYQFQGCVGCERCRTDKVCTRLKDGMTLIYPDIVESKGLVLVSPTHNYNVTAWMKAFIDRLYCFYNFNDRRPRGWSSRLAGQGRKAALAAVCEQENKADMGFTIDAMRIPLQALGYEIVGELTVFSVFDRAKVRDDKAVMDKAAKLGSELAESLLR